jgi:hypothetical protein
MVDWDISANGRTSPDRGVKLAKAEISAGACGFSTIVVATMDGRVCKLALESECEAIRRLATELTQVDPFREISFRKGKPQILDLGSRYCTHPACPVPVGIIKAVEIEAGLNLPSDVSIKLTK